MLFYAFRPVGLFGLAFCLLASMLLFVPAAAAKDDLKVRKVKRLTESNMDVDNPSFSPDGKLIAVSNISLVNGVEADELWVVATETGETRKLLDGKALGSYSSKGYSIWNIKWNNMTEVSFWLSDRDSNRMEVTVPIFPGSEPLFGERVEDVESSAKMSAMLKMFLLTYYPEDSPRRKHLAEYKFWFQTAEYGGRWYVHYIGEQDFISVDLKKKEALKTSLSTDDIGDELEFRDIGGRLLAVYPCSSKTFEREGVPWHYVDEVVPEGRARRLFRVRGYPFIKAVGDSGMFVYGRKRLIYPFYRAVVFYYDGTELRDFETDGWHNLAFSDDGESVAFIKIEKGIRTLYVGKTGL